jgi:hypothetical protein
VSRPALCSGFFTTWSVVWCAKRFSSGTTRFSIFIMDLCGVVKSPSLCSWHHSFFFGEIKSRQHSLLLRSHIPCVRGFHRYIYHTLSVRRVTLTRFCCLMSTMIQNFAHPFWKLSAYLCQIEIPDILLCLMFIGNIATVLLLDALRRLMPSLERLFDV